MATAAEIKAFIDKLGWLAVAESNARIAAGKGFVLPSVCIAQSAIETGWGTAGIMTRANAFFGIKAGGSWTGAVYRADTWEVANGEAYNTTANFRAYSSLAASVTDYYDLIGNASRYAAALSFGNNPAAWKTPKECITAIWSGGYATDTLYVEKIMSTINARSLGDWDTLITGVAIPLGSPGATISYKDMVQGMLISADSGRSLAIENVPYAVALDLEKFIDVEEETTYTVTFPVSFLQHATTFKIGYITPTKAVFNVISNNAQITVPAGSKLGFSISINVSYTLPVAQLAVNDFSVSFVNPARDNKTPASEENYNSTLAFFVNLDTNKISSTNK